MKKSISVVVSIIMLACNSQTNKKAVVDEQVAEKKIALRTDTLNQVTLKDTLIIYESTCRGCAYENSTDFEISDSMGLVKLNNVITTDNNSEGMNGGNISKDLILVPVKTGKTIMRLYKFWGDQNRKHDSANYSSYPIEIKN